MQGITEFLPVSSTAHLLLVGRLLGHDDPGGVFTVMIQLGSILAIAWLYRSKIFEVVTSLGSRPDARHFATAIVVATIPALLAGAALSSVVKRVLYASPMVFAVAFIAGGIAMLIAERVRPAPNVLDGERTPLGRAFGIGVCQALALIPGVSRSGATIVSGMMFAFLSSLLIIKPFLGFVRRAGFAPFAWYRIALGLMLFAAMAVGWMRQ